MIYEDKLQWAQKHKLDIESFLKPLKSNKSRSLDDTFHQEHDRVFAEIDCLECANCCKTTSPIFLESDIKRLAKNLRLSIPSFIDSYLRKDEDNDYVLTKSPCPFLGLDNKCLVYESRPKACREYPHTNRKRMYQIMTLTARNSLICPAVSQIIRNIQNQSAPKG